MTKPSEPYPIPAHIISFEDFHSALALLDIPDTPSGKTIAYNNNGDFFHVFPNRVEITSNFIDSRYYKIFRDTEQTLTVEKFRPAGKKPRGMGEEDWTELGELWGAIKKFVHKKGQVEAQSGKSIASKLDRFCRLVMGQAYDMFTANPEIRNDGIAISAAYDFLCNQFFEAGHLVYFEWRDWQEYGEACLLTSTPLKIKQVSRLEKLDRTEIPPDLDFCPEILRRLNAALAEFDLGIVPFSPFRDESQTFVVVSVAALKDVQSLFEELGW